MFRAQEPYVQLDPSMNGEQHQKLFRCQVPSTYFPRLSGIAFELHKELTGPDHWCVWAGTAEECTFNNMVDFVEMQAEQTKHQFAIMGILLETPKRVSGNLHASSHFMETRMIVLGRLADEDVAGTLDQLTKPFTKGTWLLIGSIFLVYILCVVFHLLAFRPRPLSLGNMFLHFMGDHVEDAESPDGMPVRNEADTLYISSLWFLKTMMVCCLFVVVTFYELAVVNYLFAQKAKKLGKSVSNLSDSERKEYAVLKASALEDIWMQSSKLMGAVLYQAFNAVHSTYSIIDILEFF